MKAFSIIVLFLPAVCLSEITLMSADRLYSQGNFSALQSSLEQLSDSYPDHPSVIFFKLLFTKNAEQVKDRYYHFIKACSSSKYCDDALEKLVCLERSQGNLNKAEKLAHTFLDEYPRSELVDRIEYELCFIDILRGHRQKARQALQRFLTRYPQSMLVDEVIWQLEKLQDSIDERSLLQAISQENKRYSIQIGVLSRYSNAYRVQQKLLKKFKVVEIREQVLANSKLYAIWIGNFESGTRAEQYAQAFIKPHLNQYKIIEINE
ncbi:MAG: tetratricopeptide repeat protein [candidate division KSB1 bacterium]|nr:tetratricopeptide repeat protein [candidate division KSB1 bacterium]